MAAHIHPIYGGGNAVTRTIKRTRKLLLAARNATRNFYAACSRTQKLFLGGTSLAAFTTTLYAASAAITTEGLGIAPWINAALSMGILVYAVKIEHRITKLETTVALKLPK